MSVKLSNDCYIHNGQLSYRYRNNDRLFLEKDYGIIKKPMARNLTSLLVIAIATAVSAISLGIIGVFAWPVKAEFINEESVPAQLDSIATEESHIMYKAVEINQPPAAPVYVEEDIEVEEHEPTFDEQIGNSVISIDGFRLIKQHLPDIFYGDCDISEFQPMESYTSITDVNSPAYQICNSTDAYTDGNGLRRYKVQDEEFSIGTDDYMVAMGTFYKTAGTVGTRFLVVTSTGMFTVRTGDEKDDKDTDEYNMFTVHGPNDTKAIIEWIFDPDVLPDKVMSSGNVRRLDNFEEVQGDIIALYLISK